MEPSTIIALSLVILSLTEQTRALEQQVANLQQEIVYTAPVAPPPSLPEPPTATKLSNTDLKALSDTIAIKHGVSASLMRAVVAKESTWRNIQSLIPSKSGPNGREDSWGVVQINLPSHPNISKAQALNPEFALNFLASELAKGNGKKWTGYRLVKGML